MRLTEAVKKYLEWCEIEKEFSPDTIKNRTFSLEQLVDYAGDIELDSIDDEFVLRYKEWLRNREGKSGGKIKQITRQTRLSDFKELLRYCFKHDIPCYYYDKVELPKRGDIEKIWLSREEVLKLIDSIPEKTITNYRDRAMIAVLFASGIRASEMIALKKDSINLDTGIGQVVGKGRKLRPIYVAVWALKLLKTYLDQRKDDDPRLFVGHKRLCAGGRTYRRWRYVTYQLNREGASSQVHRWGKLVLKKSIGCHTFRHSFATDLLRKGCDIRLVQGLMGHARISSTQVYTHYVDAQLYEAYKTYAETTWTWIIEKKLWLLPKFKMTLQFWKG